MDKGCLKQVFPVELIIIFYKFLIDFWMDIMISKGDRGKDGRDGEVGDKGEIVSSRLLYLF